jgi:hypothetical protein
MSITQRNRHQTCFSFRHAFATWGGSATHHLLPDRKDQEGSRVRSRNRECEEPSVPKGARSHPPQSRDAVDVAAPAEAHPKSNAGKILYIQEPTTLRQ